MTDWWKGEPWDDPTPPVGTVGGSKDMPIERVRKCCKKVERSKESGCGKLYVGWAFKSNAPASVAKHPDLIVTIDGVPHICALCDDCVNEWRKHPDTVLEIERERERQAIVAQEYSRPLRTGQY